MRYAGQWEREAPLPMSAKTKISRTTTVEDYSKKYQRIRHDHSILRWLCILYGIKGDNHHNEDVETLLAKLIARDATLANDDVANEELLEDDPVLWVGLRKSHEVFQLIAQDGNVKGFRDAVARLAQIRGIKISREDIRLTLGLTTILPEAYTRGENGQLSKYGDVKSLSFSLYRIVQPEQGRHKPDAPSLKITATVVEKDNEDKSEQMNHNGEDPFHVDMNKPESSNKTLTIYPDIEEDIYDASPPRPPKHAKQTATVIPKDNEDDGSFTDAQAEYLQFLSTYEKQTKMPLSMQMFALEEVDWIADEDRAQLLEELTTSTASGTAKKKTTNKGQVSPGNAPYKQQTPPVDDEFHISQQELDMEAAALLAKSPTKKSPAKKASASKKSPTKSKNSASPPKSSPKKISAKDSAGEPIKVSPTRNTSPPKPSSPAVDLGKIKRNPIRKSPAKKTPAASPSKRATRSQTPRY